MGIFFIPMSSRVKTVLRFYKNAHLNVHKNVRFVNLSIKRVTLMNRETQAPGQSLASGHLQGVVTSYLGYCTLSEFKCRHPEDTAGINPGLLPGVHSGRLENFFHVMSTCQINCRRVHLGNIQIYRGSRLGMA